MGPIGLFGITNDGLNLAVNLLILFLVVVWLALVYWTFSDARRRIGDPLVVACATAASLFPYLGTIVYMIVRPPEYLDDVRERELEMQAAEARLSQLDGHSCQYCDFEIEPTFLRCPSCLRRLKEPCGTCAKPLDPRWKICPYCESEIGQAAAPSRRRQRPVARAAPPAAADGPPTRVSAPRQEAGAVRAATASGQAAAPARPRAAPAEGVQPRPRPATGAPAPSRPPAG